MSPTLENYRSSSEYREILRILQKSSALRENFLWQSGEFGRSVVPVHHFEIDFLAREVVVYFDSKVHAVERDLPLYVKLDYKTSVFKVTEYRQGPGTLHFAFPREIKTRELRSNPRHLFGAGSEKFVRLRPSTKGKLDGLSELSVKVVDISYFGLGLSISEQNRSFLKNNRILWVTALQEEPLQYPILAEVVYITSDVDPSQYQRPGKRGKELKVGLKLSGVFPLDDLARFIE